MTVQAALAPAISAIPDQFTLEDQPILEVPFTVWDPDTPVSELRFSTSFSSTSGLWPRDPNLIVVVGTGTNRWFSIYPPPDASGPAQASITVSDGTGLSAMTRFQVQVQPVNDPPRLPPIPDQLAVQGQGILTIPFTVTDPDSPLNLVRLQAWSSRPSVVSNPNLRISQGISITNRNLLVTLSTNALPGSTAITILAADGNATNTTPFILTVQPPDFALTGVIPGSTTSTFEPVWGDFNGDGRLDVVVSPSEVLTNRGNGQFAHGLSIVPGTPVSGGAAADYDGDGDLDLLFYNLPGPQGTTRLLRNEGPGGTNLVPVMVNWGANWGRAIWADLDQDGDLDIATGSIQIRWLRNDGSDRFSEVSTGIPASSNSILIAVLDFDNDGDQDILGASQTFSILNPSPRLYANDGHGRFTDSQIYLPQGRVQAAGSEDVDGDGLNDLWLVQVPGQVVALTDPLIVLRQDRGRFVETFRLEDPAVTQASLVTAWADFDNDGDVDFVGPYWPPQPRATNFPALYRNDGTGNFSTSGLRISTQFGTLLPAAADFDDDGSPDLLYRMGATSGTLLPMHNQSHLVNPLPGAPWGLHAFVADDIVMLFWNDADDANQSSALSYNVRVGTAPGKNDAVPSMSTTNGIRMIPARGNAGNNNWIAAHLPLERLNTETLYWSVQAVDNGFQGGPFAPEQTFLINLPGNQPPAILGISDLTISEDTTGNLTIYVTDDRTAASALRVLATSSNTILMPATGVKLSGFTNTAQGLRVNLSLTPLADRFGATTITVTATDRGGLTTSRFFVVTVTPVNDPPSLMVAESLLALASAPTPPLPVSASDKESPIEELTLTAQSLTPLVVPTANISITRVQGGWQVVATPVTAEAVQVRIELALKDPQGAESKRIVTVQFERVLLQSHTTLQVSGSWPNQLIWADFNGDRRMELLTSDVQDDSLTIHEIESGSLPVRSLVTSPANYAFAYDVGDFDNDGDADLLVSALVDEGVSIRVRTYSYRNLGGFQFERMAGARFDPGEARFTDFDLDGRLDVLVAENPANVVLYRNGTAGFEAGLRFSLSSSLPDNALLESLTVRDLDNDGRDELILVIHYFDSHRQAVFRWFGERYVAITNDWASSPIHDIADLDQDQLPDLVTLLPAHGATKGIWRNLGGLNFVRTGPTFAVPDSRAVIADFDGDGLADVLVHGSVFNALHPGRGDFTFDLLPSPFAEANVPVAAPADFDSDGAMDLALSMIPNVPSGPAQIAIYRGRSSEPNSRPGSPANLRASIPGSNAVMLAWNHAVDANQSGGLTYNVRVGSAPGLSDVVSPMSLADGYRLVPRVGNAGWNTNFFLTALQPGRTYYWSVQGVDNSFAGGAFASEVSFTMPDAVLSLSSVSASQFVLELRAAPDTGWRLEMSSDLKHWTEYPTSGVVLQTAANGDGRVSIAVAAERQFFRVRRIE